LTLGKITESMHLNLRSKDAHAMRACAKADESWLAIKRRQTRKGKQNRQKHRYECARPRRKSCLVLRVWGGALRSWSGERKRHILQEVHPCRFHVQMCRRKMPRGGGGGGGRDRRLVVPAGRCNVRFHLVRDFFADFPALDSHFLQQ